MGFRKNCILPVLGCVGWYMFPDQAWCVVVATISGICYIEWQEDKRREAELLRKLEEYTCQSFEEMLGAVRAKNTVTEHLKRVLEEQRD